MLKDHCIYCTHESTRPCRGVPPGHRTCSSVTVTFLFEPSKGSLNVREYLFLRRGCVIQNTASQLANVQNPQSTAKLQKAFPVQLHSWLMRNASETARENKHIWKIQRAHVTSLIYVTKPPKAMSYQYCNVSLLVITQIRRSNDFPTSGLSSLCIQTTSAEMALQQTMWNKMFTGEE